MKYLLALAVMGMVTACASNPVVIDIDEMKAHQSREMRSNPYR